jgi:two-component system sensor kinase FixL
LASGQAMLSADGQTLGAVLAMHDITERKLLERQLLHHAKDLEARNKELNDFAYIASHDLQEPLHKIQAFGDLVVSMEGERLSEESRDYLRRMREAAGRLRTLIDDLLALCHVTSQTRPFVSVDLSRIANEAGADLEPRIKLANARVEIGKLPTVKADPTQMRQLLQNLIGNALKFRRDDVTPHIQIFARRITEKLPEGRAGEITAWQLCVEDNGIGFEMKYLDGIFAPFGRLHGRSRYEGTGMGLAICQKIVACHGGEITAVSRVGEGSLFICTLPVRNSGAGKKSVGKIATPGTMMA